MAEAFENLLAFLEVLEHKVGNGDVERSLTIHILCSNVRPPHSEKQVGRVRIIPTSTPKRS